MCATVPTSSEVARARLLWAGSLSRGQSTSIEGLSRYDRLLAKTSGSAATLVLTRQSSAEGELNANMAGGVSWPGNDGGLYVQAVQTSGEGDDLTLIRAVRYHVSTSGRLSVMGLEDLLQAVWGLL